MSLTAYERTTLSAYDGKNVAPFRELLSALEPSEAEVKRFLAAADSPSDEIEMGSTWLVKNLAKKGRLDLPPSLTRTLVKRLRLVRQPLARLELLQTLPYCTIGAATARTLYPLLEQWLETEQHGLTRAWVFNGFAEIARSMESFKDQVTERLSRAYHDERPAVRARIRNALDGL